MGHATNIITELSVELESTGLTVIFISVGLESTGLPVIFISVAVISSYYLSEATGISDGKGKLLAGLYATDIATMGIFESGVYVLSISGFGPIADNAGGIVEMSD
jgi:Na+/H+-translocating membrane pyrophosphatase